MIKEVEYLQILVNNSYNLFIIPYQLWCRIKCQSWCLWSYTNNLLSVRLLNERPPELVRLCSVVAEYELPIIINGKPIINNDIMPLSKTPELKAEYA